MAESFTVPPLQLCSESKRTLKNLRLSKSLNVFEGTTVLDVCKTMAAICVDAILVTNTSDWISGIVTDKDIVNRVIAEELRPDHTLLSKVMTRNLTYVGSSASAFEALQIMTIGKFRHLPVVENSQIIGLLDITSCLCDAISRMRKVANQGSVIATTIEGVERRYGSNLRELSSFMGTLRQHMFKSSLSTIILEPSRVATVSPSDTVYVAAKKMRDSCVNYVLIMTGNRIHGILTSKDILMRVVSQNLSPELTLVKKVMTPDPKCTTLDTTILDALNIMHDGKVLHLPVVDKDGNVAACLDVLQISYGAISNLGSISDVSTNVAFTVIQKILDSKLILKHDTPSEIKINMSQFGNSFPFQLKDHKGRVHRFNWGTYNLAELVSAVMQLGGVSDDQKRFHLLYKDYEGDKVVLSTDGDLVDAVAQAKSVGHKVLRIHLQYYDSWTSTSVFNVICMFVVPLVLVFFDISLKLGWWTKA